MSVAIVQGELLSDFRQNWHHTRELAGEAAGGGAALVVFPETWLPGYPVWFDVCRDVGLWDHAPTKALHADYAAASVAVDGAEGAAIAQLAKSLGVTLVIGVSERVDRGPGRGTLYNSLLTYGPNGVLLNHHRKLMPTHTERLVWGVGDGDGLAASETPVGRVGGLICWEHWMPLARQAMHESGEDIHIAAWPTAHERSQIASRHYAFEGRCFVLVAGSVMRASSLPANLEPHAAVVSSPDQLVMRGGSAIIGPDGQYMVEPVFDRPCIVRGELELQRVREESMALDVTGHYARPDILSFHVTRGARRGNT